MFGIEAPQTEIVCGALKPKKIPHINEGSGGSFCCIRDDAFGAEPVGDQGDDIIRTISATGR